MNIFLVAVFAVAAALLSVTLREQRQEFALAISLCAGAVLGIYILTQLFPIIRMVDGFFEKTGLDSQYGQILLKAMGICLVTQIAHDTCVDAKETALASKVVFAGRMMVLVLALPMFQYVMDIATGLL